jgi:hypothetical protein
VTDFWHIGLAVPDLDEGMRSVGAAFDISFRPVHERTTTIVDESGKSHDVVCRFTFSSTAPFSIEMWQAIPGSPLAAPETGWLHHVGYWVADLGKESERLEAAGFGCFMSGPSLAIHRGPGGLMLEPCDLQRDRPFLRDLFPADSPFHGEPDNSEAI